MNSLNNNDAGTHIFENLESLTENELLELSTQLDTLSEPSIEGALGTFKRDYLPVASEVSLYDFEREIRQVKRINIKTLLVAAVMAVMMVASSMVSYAAGAASNLNKNTENKTVETTKESEKGTLKTAVEIDGMTKELYVIKSLLEEIDSSEYCPSKSVDDQTLLNLRNPMYSGNYHYSDADGNILRFNEVALNELRDGMMKKATEVYGARFIDHTTQNPFTVTELSEISYSREEAGDYYFEFFKGSNYVIESFDPFLKIHEKIFANYDTNFAMETTMSIYAMCYNAEKEVYQEFVISKTNIGCFDVVFDTPDGWVPIEAHIVIENPLIGKSRHSLSALSNEPEEPSAFRQKINAALEKHQKEKEEKNNIINEIEANQNK